MAIKSLDPKLLRRLRDRQGLLWVCQSYDLLPDATTHDYSQSIEAVRPLYRSEISDVDRGLAQLYWEAIWLEGAASPILRAVREAAQDTDSNSRRPVVLSSSEDTEATFSEDQFLPVCVLPGLLDSNAAAGARFGGVKPRVRQQIATAFAKKIERYPRRVLVVLGAASAEDLETHLYPALEDNHVVGLDLVIVQDENAPAPPPPENAAIQLHVWHGTPQGFLAELTTAGVPTAKQSSGLAIRTRVGDGKTAQLELTPDAIQRIFSQFVLITEDDLRPPTSFTLDDLTAFLSGTVDRWTGYSAGVPVARSYKTAKNRSLPDELLYALRELEESAPNRSVDRNARRRATTLTLPCVGGSGTTTLLRIAAFQAAAEGYPTLLLRPGVKDIDIEIVSGFATAISELVLKRGIVNMPPLAIVLDVDAEDIRTSSQLAGILAAQGRATVVLRAVENDDQSHSSYLSILKAEATNDEVGRCEETFRNLATRWQLSIDQVPSLADWMSYQVRSRWVTPTQVQSQSLFWVALRFFLTSGLARSDAETVHDALSRWIIERDQQVTDQGMRRVLRWVAALSSQRIVCPLSVALRPVNAGSFSSAMVPVFRQWDDLVDWQDFSHDLGDYAIQFRHPALGEEYLRLQIGVASPETAVNELAPLLRQLVPGRPADRWLAESLVTRVITPSYQGRSQGDWEWRLAAYDNLPPALAMDSRSILHHWARCLYQSADPRNDQSMSIDKRRQRFETAIDYLKKAIKLPRRQQREDHPSHLWNTLGVAYSRLARLLDPVDGDAGRQAWNDAWEAFQRSIELLPANDEALIAFSHRMLDHAGVFEQAEIAGPPAGSAVEEVARALALLDEAEELIKQSQDPDVDKLVDLSGDRTRAFAWLSQDIVAKYLRDLKSSPTPELGYYCEAQLIAQRSSTVYALDDAIKVLDDASQITPLGARSLRLLISLLRRHDSRQYDFHRMLGVYEQLEGVMQVSLQPIEQFRLAVLYFQVGKIREGEVRFRRLRELSRRSDITAPAVRDFLRQSDDPSEPRPTQIRVSRLISEWRAEGFVEELGITIPLRPRHFSPMPRQNDVVSCLVRFEFNGPLAIPKRFVASSTEKT